MPSPLDEFEVFCQKQIARIQSRLSEFHLESSRVATQLISQDVSAFPVRHAVGKRKPSLEELDSRCQSSAQDLQRRS